MKTISHWPDHKRLAVLTTVVFEVWSEGKAPSYSPMLSTPIFGGRPLMTAMSLSAS